MTIEEIAAWAETTGRAGRPVNLTEPWRAYPGFSETEGMLTVFHGGMHGVQWCPTGKWHLDAQTANIWRLAVDQGVDASGQPLALLVCRAAPQPGSWPTVEATDTEARDLAMRTPWTTHGARAVLVAHRTYAPRSSLDNLIDSLVSLRFSLDDFIRQARRAGPRPKPGDPGAIAALHRWLGPIDDARAVLGDWRQANRAACPTCGGHDVADSPPDKMTAVQREVAAEPPPSLRLREALADWLESQ